MAPRGDEPVGGCEAIFLGQNNPMCVVVFLDSVVSSFFDILTERNAHDWLNKKKQSGKKVKTGTDILSQQNAPFSGLFLRTIGRLLN